ncbi:MAG: HIRAN domain-containing protein [Ferruginibacter sp.]
MSNEQQMINEEQSIIKVSSGLLSALSSGQLNIDVFKKEILVLECLVAGTSFRKLDAVEPQLTATVRLDIKREAANEFDPFAVALHFNDTKVGYIPKDKNEVIARLMDAGKSFYATVEAKEWEGNWLRLGVRVYLKD